jgi:hypothetical protein
MKAITWNVVMGADVLAHELCEVTLIYVCFAPMRASGSGPHGSRRAAASIWYEPLHSSAAALLTMKIEF